MANDIISTDLAGLHQAIRDQIAQQFPNLRSVEFYRDDESENLATPACLLQMEEIEADEDDIGTNQLSVSLRFSAKLVFSREHGPRAPLEIRLAAAALSAFINRRRFLPHISAATFLRAGEDHFTPDLAGKWECFSLEWVHRRAIFGDNIWRDRGTIFEDVYCAQKDGFLNEKFVEVSPDDSRRR